MERLTGRLVTKEEQEQQAADSQKRLLDFNAECRALGYNPGTKIFGFMYNKGLSEMEYREKLTARFNTWLNNLRNMPIEIKKEKINEAQKELEANFNSMVAKTDYLYRQEKLDFLATFKDKIRDAIHIGKLETMPTWAKEKELELIWLEVLSLKWVDAKDESNFFKAFGIFRDSEPFTKFSLCLSGNQLKVLLAMMTDKNKKHISMTEKRIANNLFTIQLTKSKLKKGEFEKWSNKLPTTSRIRNAIAIIPQDAGTLRF